MVKVCLDLAIVDEVKAFVDTVNKKGMALEEFSKRARLLRRKLNIELTGKRELIQYAKALDIITELECENYIYYIENKRRELRKNIII